MNCTREVEKCGTERKSRSRKVSMIHEKFGADQQRIPGKRGAALIGRILRPCGAQRQYAP